MSKSNSDDKLKALQALKPLEKTKIKKLTKGDGSRVKKTSNKIMERRSISFTDDSLTKIAKIQSIILKEERKAPAHSMIVRMALKLLTEDKDVLLKTYNDLKQLDSRVK